MARQDLVSGPRAEKKIAHPCPNSGISSRYHNEIKRENTIIFVLLNDVKSVFLIHELYLPKTITITINWKQKMLIKIMLLGNNLRKVL
jgi:hypothetical protein